MQSFTITYLDHAGALKIISLPPGSMINADNKGVRAIVYGGSRGDYRKVPLEGTGFRIADGELIFPRRRRDKGLQLGSTFLLQHPLSGEVYLHSDSPSGEGCLLMIAAPDREVQYLRDGDKVVFDM